MSRGIIYNDGTTNTATTNNDIFKPQTWEPAYSQEDTVESFLQSEYFGRESIKATDEVTQEYEAYENQILKYTPSEAEPNIIDIGKRGSITYKIPLIAVSVPISLKQGDITLPGEIPINSTTTTADRLNRLARISEQKLSNMFKRTREKQCADLIQNGKIVMEEWADGKFVAKKVATFDNSVRVDAETKWTTTTVDIYEQLKTYGTELRKHIPSNLRLILGSEAFKYFVKNEYIQKILDLRNFNIGNYSPQDANKTGKYKGVAYVGTLIIAGVGAIKIYTYDAYYKKDDSDLYEPYIDPKVAILLPETSLGAYNFGMLSYVDASTRKFYTVEAKEFTRYFINERTNTFELIKMSKPLPVPNPLIKWKTIKVVD